MKQIGLTFITALAVAAVGACAKDDSSIGKKLDDIDKRLAGIESKLEKGVPARAGAARGQARPRPQRPDPNKVYSVPIAGAPFKGVENAKITIVEAFEFA